MENIVEEVPEVIKANLENLPDSLKSKLPDEVLDVLEKIPYPCEFLAAGVVLIVTWFIVKHFFSGPEDEEVVMEEIKESVRAPLSIGAYNIQVFGKSKIQNPVVLPVLVEIISRFDLILLQEIRDISGDALKQLIGQLNDELYEDATFHFVQSEPLGRSDNHKEQYAFLFRQNNLKLVEAKIYPNESGVFHRPPFCAVFETIGDKDEMLKRKFTVVGIHADPDDAVAEISALVDVYEWAREMWADVMNVIIMGDFNAGKNYIPNKYWEDVKLATDDRFTWLIPNDVDTTTAESTNHAYDRIVVAGPEPLENMVVDEATIEYDQLGLGAEDAKAVSDHCPVFFRWE